MKRVIMRRVMNKSYQTVMMDLTKIIKIDMCDIRIIRKQWMHTYRRHRLWHVMAWMS
jgi:hypothetical protein